KICFYYYTDKIFIQIENIYDENENYFSLKLCGDLSNLIKDLFPINDLAYVDLKHPHLYHIKQTLENFISLQNIKCPEIIFIPSVRSFFTSTIYENIFSFIYYNKLDHKSKIDYLSKHLGAIYEQARNNYSTIESQDNKERLEIKKIIKKIIKGNYLQEEKTDWIIHEDNRKVKLSDASSGQQEAFPITLILSVLPFLGNTQNYPLFRKEPEAHLFPDVEKYNAQAYHFFIEEPEAHLFPDSQKYMVEIFSLVFNLTEEKNGFFITTHSPYILTAFNNLIQAGNARKKILERGNKPEELEKLFSIVSEDKILDIEDFGVYTLENGELKSIIDEENRLIDETIIDEISDEIGDIFDKLVDLELGEE
ncbi:MAG: AAA family ATPase, partial [Crocosphaera sp.]|nr:AAA family ATPase [Crocosphaera sp.]